MVYLVAFMAQAIDLFQTGAIDFLSHHLFCDSKSVLVETLLFNMLNL